ncbi:type II toxin-antitoxin system VapC family toxin [Longimicrobium sp.]|uniref:type II toxin-antitoxin system VapC family toxin n=1 Tax=Longimicrobium sp. TaxID=2029185 RepID=UPI002E354E1B|nr:type II toxin-antitoxin system VapC family toxin [Longimicrobium sp.]HEX6038314.1 type II toxin-antitoxin system VapC family toxin [Longimicrobium sp.]
MLFLDASALTKAYVDEAGDANVRGLLQRGGGELFLSEFVALEVLTSIRNAHRGTPRGEYVDAVRRFWSDYHSRFSVVEVDTDTVWDAISLTSRHRYARARSMDLLHLATALRLQASRTAREVTMVTSDRDLAALSSECGLRTFDPSREPLAALPGRSW